MQTSAGFFFVDVPPTLVVVRKTAVLVAVLSLAACQRQPAPDAVEPSEAASPKTEAPQATDRSVDTLAGAWRVAGIDGEPFNEEYGLALYANDYLIYWEPECAGQDRVYRIDGMDFSAEPPQTDSPRIICEIGVPDRLADVWSAMDVAHTIERTDEGGILIAGGGRSVTLFRQ